MAIAIQPYTEALVPGVRDFNTRISASDAFTFGYPESPVPGWLAPCTPGGGCDPSIFQEMFVATDETGAVRGGYVLKHQPFTVSGQVRSIGFYRSPLSEGIAEKRFAAVGPQLLRDALRRQPLMFSLGIGGMDQALARMLRAMRWNLSEVPFFFRIEKGHRVFRELRAVRTSRFRTMLLDVAAWTGAASLASPLLHRVSARLPRGWRVVEAPPEVAAADTLFSSVAGDYSFCAVRTRAVLDRLYEIPNPHRRFLTVLDDDGATAGWAVVLNTPMRGDKYFGNLQLGSIVDVLGRSGAESMVIAAAAGYLKSRGADLVVSNQSHRRWQSAMRDNGFRQGPSNFLFAASPALWELLGGQDSLDRVHLLRADGDGPIHL